MSDVSDESDESAQSEDKQQLSTDDNTNIEQELPDLYNDLRKQGVMSDFTIKVEDKEFSVHRETITTHSEYFRAMLAHDTKENQQEFVDVKVVPVDGVEECIDFMYTGKFNIHDKNVEDILKTADMWQLSKVNEACSEFLKNQLHSGNCVSTLYIVTKYSCLELKETVQQLYSENFDVELTKLLQFSKDEFVEYLESHTLANEVCWDAIITWIKHEPARRGENIHALVKTLYKNDIPSSGLLEKMWAEPMFKCSFQSRELLFEKIFLDLEVFKRSLDVESYFVLKEISNEFKYVMKQIKDLLSKFFKRQIVLLSQKMEFKYLSPEEMLQLFSREKSDIFAPEKWWWNTAIMWVKHNSEREKLFPKLLSFIKFYDLPSSFINFIVRHEPLVIGSRECCKIVMSGLLVPEKQPNRFYVAVLYSDGRIRCLNITTKSWEDLPKLPEAIENAEIFYFNEKLCLINGSRLFYLQHNVWVIRGMIEPRMTGSKVITTYDNFICIACDRKLFCYDSIVDSWDVTDLPDSNWGVYSNITRYGGGHPIERTPCVAVLGENVYIRQNAHYDTEKSREWRLNVKSKQWLQRDVEERISGLITIDNKIYSCDGGNSIKKFEVANHSWELLANRNMVGLYRQRVQSTLPKFTLLNVSGRIFGVDAESKIHSYDELFKTWTFQSQVPVFSSGFKGQESEVKAISVSSYNKNEIINSPLQKRRRLE